MLRFLLMPFLLGVFLFTAYFHYYRVQADEWIVLSATTVDAYTSQAGLYVLLPQTGEYARLDTPEGAIIQELSNDNEWLYFNASAEKYYDGYHRARDIYRIQLPDFSSVENLTKDEFTDDYFSAISPDGEWVYYASEKAYDPKGASYGNYRDWWRVSYWWEVFRMRLDGSGKERLTISPNVNTWLLDFTPDQQHMVIGMYTGFGYMRGIDYEKDRSAMYLSSLDGQFQYLLYLDENIGHVNLLGISQDGKWIYCQVDYDIALYSLPTASEFQRIRMDGSETQVIDSRRLRVGLIGYSPDNAKLYYRTYQRFQSEGESSEAWAGLHYADVLNDQFNESTIAANVFIWSMTPDKQWLYYAQDGKQIYRLNTDNQTLEYLTELGEYNYFLSFSLDDEWIYFRSVSGEKAYLYKMRLDGSALQQLADISELDMCLYPDRCQDNLFVVKDFGMNWHPSQIHYGSGLLLMSWLVSLVIRRCQHYINRCEST